MVCYISYAISEPFAAGALTFERHRQSVEFLAAEVARLGFAPVIPAALPGISHKMAMQRDHELLRHADVLVVHQSEWTARSRGVQREVRWAKKELGLPVFYNLEELREWKKRRLSGT